MANYLLTIWLCELGNLRASIGRLGKLTGEGIRSAVRFCLVPGMICGILTAVRQIFLRCMPPFCAVLIFAVLYILCAYIFCAAENGKEKTGEISPVTAG